jgi:hypothetical protein
LGIGFGHETLPIEAKTLVRHEQKEASSGSKKANEPENGMKLKILH